MKKHFSIFGILIMLFVAGVLFVRAQQQQVPHVDSKFTENLKHVYYLFNGSWLPSYKPELIGPQNYKTLQNMRYTNDGIEGINGYSKINPTLINVNYYQPRAGFHFKKDRPSETHALIQAYNYDGTISKLFDNKTAIPNVGNFETAALHTDESYGTFTGTYGHAISAVTALYSPTATHAIGVGALMSATATHAMFAEAIYVPAVITYETLRSRFSKGPMNTMIYSNSVKTKVWGGDSSRVAAFIVSDAAVTEYATNGKNYTEQVNNEYTDSTNVANINTTSPYFIVGASRPISGLSVYCSTVNAAGHSIGVSEFNGTTWASLTSTDSTTGFSTSSGKIAFSSTVSTSKPKYLEGGIFYWYQVHLSGGGASIYNVALDIPFQDLVDLWDGTHRRCISFQASRSNNYKDWSQEVNIESSDLYPIGAEIGGLTANDHIILGFEDRTQAVYFQMLSGNTNAFGPNTSISYYNGSTWVKSGVTYDGTGDVSGVTPLGRTGVLTWQPPSIENEFPQALFGVYGYFYKLQYGGTLGGTGAPDNLVIADVVYGIPAPLKLDNFKFATFFKNRVFLCGFLKGNEPNRIDYSKANTPDCWNGAETSNRGRQSLYVGGGAEELTGAIQIYNRFGTDLRNDLVIFKPNETYTITGDGPESFKVSTISENVGCPAPYTITSIEVGYEMVQNELRRNVIMFLSSSGPYIFDNAVLVQLGGLESYFDQNNDKYIGASKFKDAFAWYDPNYSEWHLRIGNYWFVYDFVRRKWYSRNTGTAELPMCAFQVSDTYGAKYIYAGIDTGYMTRLESGTSWLGVPIAHVVETGDFYLDNDAWNQTLLRRIKVASRKTSEATPLLVTHYSDASESGTSIFSIGLDSGTTLTGRSNKSLNQQAWLHRLKFSTETDTENKGWQPLGWGYEYYVVREDEK